MWAAIMAALGPFISILTGVLSDVFKAWINRPDEIIRVETAKAQIPVEAVRPLPSGGALLDRWRGVLDEAGSGDHSGGGNPVS